MAFPSDIIWPAFSMFQLLSCNASPGTEKCVRPLSSVSEDNAGIWGHGTLLFFLFNCSRTESSPHMLYLPYTLTEWDFLVDLRL